MLTKNKDLALSKIQEKISFATLCYHGFVRSPIIYNEFYTIIDDINMLCKINPKTLEITIKKECTPWSLLDTKEELKKHPEPNAYYSFGYCTYRHCIIVFGGEIRHTKTDRIWIYNTF